MNVDNIPWINTFVDDLITDHLHERRFTATSYTRDNFDHVYIIIEPTEFFQIL